MRRRNPGPFDSRKRQHRNITIIVTTSLRLFQLILKRFTAINNPLEIIYNCISYLRFNLRNPNLGETVDDLLVEAFAVVREAAWRTVEMCPSMSS